LIPSGRLSMVLLRNINLRGKRINAYTNNWRIVRDGK